MTRRDRFEAARGELVETIRGKGVHDLSVLEAFGAIPRHEFLPDAVLHRAYEDAAVPIGFQQTASQPSLQALSIQLLEIDAGDKVLEVGTGSGHQTAVLARLAHRVYSIDRIRELSVRARKTLDRLRISNVALMVGDGTIGWSRYSPFDAIIVAAAAPAPPQSLIDQLAPGGRLLIPIGSRSAQRLVLYRKDADGGVTEEESVQCTFVPLLGRYSWSAGEPDD